MRPLPSGDALPACSSVKPRSRKSSLDNVTATAAAAIVTPFSHVPTTFAMKRVGDLEHSVAGSHGLPGEGKQCEAASPTLGVQSLADTLEAAFGTEDASADVKSQGSASSRPANTPERPQTSPGHKLKRKPHSPATPVSFTQHNVGALSISTSAVSGTPRSASLQSLRLSDEDSMIDELSSQAIASSGDEDDQEDAVTQQGGSASFPQLVMPSIQMPRRRPFTTKGKAMGKLKIMVAGQSGVGKTSLIRSIVQICDDIVHVDPLAPVHSNPQSNRPRASFSRNKGEFSGGRRITEIHASTKPYPHWWTDEDENRTLRRRKSSVDSVLERNICFVDTPGILQHSSDEQGASKVVNYVQSLMHKTVSFNTMEDTDMLGVVSGSGGILVDVVLYLLPPDRDISKDIDLMLRLTPLTNVIPIIAKSDTISTPELVALKTAILTRLQLTSVKPFLFGKPLDDAILAVQSLPVLAASQANSVVAEAEPSQYPFSTPTYPFAISSTLGSDNDIMDASLLMSPDYVQPLLPSELSTLVAQIFDPDTISWLRHSAAKGFLVWRRTFLEDTIRSPVLPYSASPTTASVGVKRANIGARSISSISSVASPSGMVVPHPGSPFYTSNLPSPFLASSPSLSLAEMAERPGSFSLARYADGGQSELPQSELRIAKWATELQRSLRNERNRFEDVQRGDRAQWLLDQLGEEVSRGTIAAAAGGPPRAEWAVVRHGDEKDAGKPGIRYRSAAGLDARDPLGLCSLGERLVRRGTVLVKVLGGMSVLGAVLVTAARAMGAERWAVPFGLGWWNWVMGGDE